MWLQNEFGREHKRGEVGVVDELWVVIDPLVFDGAKKRGKLLWPKYFAVTQHSPPRIFFRQWPSSQRIIPVLFQISRVGFRSLLLPLSLFLLRAPTTRSTTSAFHVVTRTHRVHSSSFSIG